MQPMHDFSAMPEKVGLFQGDIEFRRGDKSRTGTGEVQLRSLPSPRVIVNAKLEGTLFDSMEISFSGSDDGMLSLNGKLIEGFLVRSWSKADGIELEWTSCREPFFIGDMQAKTTVAVVLHLFNFPDFLRGQHQDIAPAGCVLLVLDSDEWRASIQSLPHNATYQAWEKIKQEGGSHLTHVLKLERKDGAAFSADDVEGQRYMLASFLSFTKGGKCWPVCEVGLDAEGGRVWQGFASPQASNPPYAWAGRFEGHQVEKLFPLFAKRWQQSEEWQSCLVHAIYWYTQANTSGGHPGIDVGIILAQTALERLAHHYLVVDRKMISDKGFDDLRASDRLRMLFSVCGISAELTSVTPDILQVNAGFKKESKWMDAPHAITDIRNSLVHPVSKKKVHGCYVDAWKLSLWYLELCILAVCGFDGRYQNRMTVRHVGQVENVPWMTKGEEQ